MESILLFQNPPVATQGPAGEPVLFAVVGMFVFLAILSIYRRREFLGQIVRWLFLGAAGYGLAILIAKQFTADPIKTLLIALLVELVVLVRTKPKRSRYISRSERRKAIAEFERSGKRYDPKRHHIDHVIPHASGGSNRADNLRVTDRERNLAKSDRSPWWDVFGRR